MEIKNFTDITIRLGQFPFSVDVCAIDNYHSSYGLKMFYYGYNHGYDKQFMQIRRRLDVKDGLMIYIFKWEEQLENLPEYVGEVVFDSRSL